MMLGQRASSKTTDNRLTARSPERTHRRRELPSRQERDRRERRAARFVEEEHSDEAARRRRPREPCKPTRARRVLPLCPPEYDRAKSDEEVAEPRRHEPDRVCRVEHRGQLRTAGRELLGHQRPRTSHVADVERVDRETEGDERERDEERRIQRARTRSRIVWRK